MRLPFGLGVTILSPLLVLAHAGEAQACGGCFVPQAMSTVVTAHRMAFATSGTRTVLWDQIRYSGNPAEFSWVLPVKGDVRLEASTDAWFEALETVTNARVSPPQLTCYNRKSGGGGCDCGFAESDSASSTRFGGGSINDNGGVVVSHQGSVGPYDYVQIMGGGEALAQWLPRNGYVVPADVQPVITAYADEGYGFIALKLQPGAMTSQMTPVRVVTEGSGSTLPLRMVAAGTGPFVAITLYVIAEGRYEVDGFGQAQVNASSLSWDWARSVSSYGDARDAALKADGGKVWLTSFASLKGFTTVYRDVLNNTITYNVNRGGTGSGSSGPSPFTNLTDLYFAQAAANASRPDVCSMKVLSNRLVTSLVVNDNCKGTTGMTGGVDGGAPRADAGSSSQSWTGCPAAPTGTVAASDLVCDGFSDIAAAMIGMHPDTVWLTRLESNLPRVSLAGDLKIKPAAMQTAVAHTYRAAVHVNPPCDLLENHPEVEVTLVEHRSQQAGVGVLSGMGLFFARRLRRRRKIS